MDAPQRARRLLRSALEGATAPSALVELWALLDTLALDALEPALGELEVELSTQDAAGRYLGATLRHLYPENLVMASIAIEGLVVPQTGEGEVRYPSRDGREVSARSKDVVLLDAALEQRLDDAFPAVEARTHWDTDEPLPAGTGLYGSGFRALGEWMTSPVPPIGRWYPAVEGEDVVRGEEGLPGGDPVPWRAVAAVDGDRSDSAWLDHALRRLQPPKHVIVGGERKYSFQFADEAEFRRLQEEKVARERVHVRHLAAVARRVLDADATLYVGAHAAWDRWNEDWLSRDTVSAAIDSKRVLFFHRYIHRYYG